jgi:predicted permease
VAFLPRVSSLFRNIAQRERVERDLHDELHAVFELLVDEKTRAGVRQEDARRAAHLELGRIHSLKEQVWDAKSGAFLDTFVQDVRSAVRALRRSPVFTCLALVTLVVGVGSNAAIFNLAYALLLKPLPVPQPERLVRYRLTADGPLPGGDLPSTLTVDFPMSKAMFDGLRIRQRTSTDLFAWGSTPWLAVRREGVPATAAHAAWVSGSALRTLGVSPLHGRMIAERDDREGGGTDGWVANVSHRYWQSTFGGDPEIVGQRLIVQDVPVTIVGVLPPGFNGVLPGVQPDIVMPLAAEPAIAGRESRAANPGTMWLVVMGRLRAEATPAAATAELAAIASVVLDEVVPRQLRDADFEALRLDVTSGSRGWSLHQIEYRRPLLLLQALACVVLLLVAANLSGLFMAKAAQRLHEFDVRGALGASQRRLLRQLLAESILLAAIATPVACIAAMWISAIALPFFTRAGIFGDGTLTLDLALGGVVIGTAAVAAIATAIVASLLPAVILVRRAGRPGVQAQHMARLAGASHWLMPGQIALSFVLTVLAVACATSLLRLMTAPTGMTTSAVVVSRPDLRERGERGEARHALDQRIVDDLRAQPGVSGAGVTSEPPMQNERAVGHYRAIGSRSLRAANVPEVAVGPGYFDTIGVKVVVGRDFAADDGDGALMFAR